MKAENTPRERNNRSNNSFESLCKRREIKKNTFKRCRCAKGHIDIAKTKKFVYKRNRLITASILRFCGATSARPRCSSSAAGCLTALSRRPYFVSSACLSERRVTSRTLCTSSHVVLSILPRQMKRKRLWKRFIINILSINKNTPIK